MKYEGDGRYMGVVVWSKVDFNFMDAYLKSAIFLKVTAPLVIAQIVG